MLCIPSMRNVKIDCLVIEGQRRPTQSKAFDKMLLDYLVEPVNHFNPEFTIVILSTTSRELLSQFSTYSG